MASLGDIRLGQTIDLKFTTRNFTTGAPFALAGSPAISAYIGNSTTQITAGITLTTDFDAVTGLNNVRVVASSGNGFAAATDIDLVITAGTVNGISVVGEVIGSFSIENRSALMPTTASRTLDVSAGGEAGVDWANVGSPTTTLNLSGTSTKALEPTTAGRTLDVTTTGEAGIDWANIGAPTTTVNLSGTSIATAAAVTTVNGLAANVITATSINTGAITAAKFAANAIDAAALASDAVTEIQSGLATAANLATVAGYLDTEIAAILADTNELQTDWADGGRLDLILDARASQASVNTIDGIVDDILLDTAEIGTAGAGLTNINLPNQTMDIIGNITGNLSGSVGSVTGFTASDVAAIKAKTDNLPTDPADQSLIITATNTILADTNAIVATTNKLEDTLEDDAGTYRFTAHALEEGPTGGGGTSDWDADERTAIRAILGIPATGTTPDDPTTGILDTIRDLALDIPTNAELATALATADDAVLAQVALVKAKTDNLPTDPADQSLLIAATDAIATAVADLPTNAELATALAAADDAVLVQVALVKAKTDNLPSDPADQSLIISATDALATLIGDVPTNAELGTALATADDAVLAQVALVKAKTDLIPAAPAAVSDIPTTAQIAAGVLDLADGIETGLTLRQAQRLQTAALAGELAGAATTEVTIRNAVADSKTRITATVDADGNRTSVVTDVT